MPRESLEDTIKRLLDARDAEHAEKAKAEKDPKAWLEQMTRRVVNEEFDKRLSEGRKGRTQGGGGDDDEDDSGFFAKLVGG